MIDKRNNIGGDAIARSLLLLTLLLIATFPLSIKSAGLSVLVIGDSNTENGFITLALADTLRRHFGVDTMGTGYIPLDSSFYELRYKRVPGVTVVYPNTWTLFDMFEGSRLAAKPYLSPNGQWLRSSAVNSIAAVIFPGNGVDVYWLASSTGGSFSITIDNAVKATVNTTGRNDVQKTTVTGLTAGQHTMQFKVTSLPASGSVTLLGFDALKDLAGQTKRSVVHNWGNGYVASVDFLNIDSTIFATGLQQLDPDIVVVLLGTNDHLQDSRSAADLKTNLKAILNRIKAAGFTSKILLVSTFMTDNSSGSTFVPQYRATSWPQAASETGVQYWDMSSWYGALNSALMMDGNHCNAAGGRKIAVEMLNQILARFPTTAINSPASTRKAAAEKVTCRDGFLSIGDNDAVYEIKMFSICGRLVSSVSGRGQCSYRPGSGVLYAPDGMYFVKVRINTTLRSLRTLVAQ